MLSVEEARARILAGLTAVGTETVPVSAAAGRVLAAAVHARLTHPPTDVSAMDGYALRAADAAAGARLRVIGQAPAGHPFAGRIGAGEAVRLFTGSAVPPGADTVLMQENADRDGDTLIVTQTCEPGRHIRAAGQDFTTGDVLLPAGTVLSARDLGLAAAANHPWLTVRRRPRVALLTTGDEISLPGEPVVAGGIVSSNAIMLAAMIERAGAEAITLPIARDDVAEIAAAAGQARADLLVTTGGASVGDHDLVQAGLAQLGFTLDFWKIAMRPGKPMIFGHIGCPVLGLPGNPVSAFVCATLFLLPALARLGGRGNAEPRAVTARLGAAVRANDHRADHLRATLSHDPEGQLVATPFAPQDSALMRLLARAEALVLRPPHAPPAQAGDIVQILLI